MDGRRGETRIKKRKSEISDGGTEETRGEGDKNREDGRKGEWRRHEGINNGDVVSLKLFS